jgi:hypothetical protein
MRAGSSLKGPTDMKAFHTPQSRSLLKASARQRRLLLIKLTRNARWTNNRLDAAEKLLQTVEKIADLELAAALSAE